MPELAELLRDHVDGAAPPITLDEVERRVGDGAAAPRSATWRRWAVAALVLVVLAVGAVALLAATGGDDPQDLDVIGPPDEGAAASAPTGTLTVAVRRPEGTVVPGEDVVLLRIVDSDGEQVGDVLVAPPGDVYDPAAEPGSVGRDVTTLVQAPGLPFGEYQLTLWVHPCDGPCPIAGDDLPSEPAEDEVACAGPVTVGALEAQITTVLGADACEHLGEPTQAQLDAAWDVYEGQRAAGWVPKSMASAVPGYPSGDGWAPTRAVPCELPVSVGGRFYYCIYDEPDGDVIGVHINDVGYVPIEALPDVDLDQAEQERQERNLEAMREELAATRRSLADEGLSPAERAELQLRVDSLEALVDQLERSESPEG